jgi:small-conductance mechanosensitive channel
MSWRQFCQSDVLVEKAQQTHTSSTKHDCHGEQKRIIDFSSFVSDMAAYRAEDAARSQNLRSKTQQPQAKQKKKIIHPLSAVLQQKNQKKKGDATSGTQAGVAEGKLTETQANLFLQISVLRVCIGKK